MRTLLIGFLTLFLFSCGPSEGDVYEHKMTESRSKVEIVGLCTEVYDYYDEKNEQKKEEDGSGLWLWTPDEDEGSSNKCVGLTDGGSSVSIERSDYFKQNYSKVN